MGFFRLGLIAFLTGVMASGSSAGDFEGVYYLDGSDSSICQDKNFQFYFQREAIKIVDGNLIGGEYGCKLIRPRSVGNTTRFWGICAVEGTEYQEEIVIKKTSRGIETQGGNWIRCGGTSRSTGAAFSNGTSFESSNPTIDPSTNFQLAAFRGIIFNQLQYTDANLYISEEWALQRDSGLIDYPHYKLTCLATVYAMIEKARGNKWYRVGADGTWAALGAVAIPGTGPHLKESRNAKVVLGELSSGNPVILRGKSPSFGDLPQHFVLVIGTDQNGDFLALDPWGGKTIIVNKKTWISQGSDGGRFEVVDIRLVRF